MIRALKLMIPRCVLQEIFDGRRVVVDRREFDLHDALIGVQLELRTQFQASNAVSVDVHQMQASDGHCNLQPLFRSPVASSQERRLAPRFRESVLSEHRERPRRIDGSGDRVKR